MSSAKKKNNFQPLGELLGKLPKSLSWLIPSRLGTISRVAFALAMWTATVLLCLRLTGVLQDDYASVLKNRVRLCESVAVSCSQLRGTDNLDDVRVLIESLKHRNPEIVSIAFRNVQDEIEASAGDHAAWGKGNANHTEIATPVFTGDQEVASVEIAFEAPARSGFIGFAQLESVRVITLSILLNALGFLFLLRRCFKHLDPSQVIPDRVRNALDTMAEVILLVDMEDRLMLVNQRLLEITGQASLELQGKNVSVLPWEGEWREAISSDDKTAKVNLVDQSGRPHSFQVNASPILDDNGVERGRLISLNDITLIEEKSAELRNTLGALEESQKEMAKQNERLSYLATRDPMTGCFNRRSFFESFEKIWHSSQRYEHDLSCIMVDVDHFKSVNDVHGHAMGDEVLKKVSGALLETARDSDIVCRYGGEEFCVLLPNVDVAGAEMAAERFRIAISELEFEKLSVTASLGCSDRLQDCDSPDAMLEQADKSLYEAKRNGRNRVVRFDQLSQASTTECASESAEQIETPQEPIASPVPQTQSVQLPPTGIANPHG